MLARINRRYFPAYWDDFFNDSFFRNYSSFDSSVTSPAVNVVEEDQAYRIDIAVPGMSRKDFRIELEDHLLTISSEQKDQKEEKSHRYMRREFSYNTFKRSFQLPETIDLDKIKASHDAGILSIELPKKEEEVQKAPKQIEIKQGSL
jgi:HSP20 family protein